MKPSPTSRYTTAPETNTTSKRSSTPGFDGSLTLPSSVIGALGLTWRRRGRVLLADSSDSVCDIFEATVIWDAMPCRTPVDAADTMPLIGMSLLDGYELIMRVTDGGDIRITALP